MQRDSEEEAWRAIVENYGDRAELEDEPSVAEGAESGTETEDGPDRQERLERLFRPLPQPAAPEPVAEERFVPPPPPPLPKLPPDRLAAWTGLFGSPTVLLVCLVLGVRLAPWMGYLLVAGFIGGFVYLVLQMPRGEDVDPWDDGARL